VLVEDTTLIHQQGETEIAEPRNKLYDSFKNGDGRYTVKGNLVVVKSDTFGFAIDVQREDIALIEWVVYK
jgi:hypothetical protein